MSMFSFQAIHNDETFFDSPVWVVYRLCQCSLFKQFTTFDADEVRPIELFIDYVNVLFSSNSQLRSGVIDAMQSCLSIMSMFSFQAIHNDETFFDSPVWVVYRLCQCSLFKQFTTLRGHPRRHTQLFIDYVNVLFSSNSQLPRETTTSNKVVYRLCQCSLFKQFTTNGLRCRRRCCCLSIMSMFSFQAIGRVRNGLNNLSPVGRGLGVTMVNLSSLLFSILQRRRGILSPALLVVFTTE